MRQPLNQSTQSAPSATGLEAGRVVGELGESSLAGQPAQPVESVSHRRLSGLVAVHAGQDAVADHSGDAGDIAVFGRVEHVARTGAANHYQDARVRRADSRNSGVRVDDRRADGDACGQPEALGRLGRQAARGLPRGHHPSGHLRLDHIDDVGMQRAQKRLGGEAVPRRPHAFVAGLASRARHLVGRAADPGARRANRPLPPRPRRHGRFPAPLPGFRAFWGRTTRAPTLPPYCLRKSSSRSRAMRLMRSVCFLAPWCFHSLGQARGFSWNSGNRQSGGPVAQGRKHGATGEVDADADDPLTRPGGLPQRPAHGLRGGFEPVFGVLQRVVGGKRLVAARQRLRNLAVPVLGACRAALGAVEVDQQRADRFRAKVQSKG